ncbi:MAG TPA: hypothetical protein DCL15_02970 [Chloroflexi bacterium]|nr:hypothetical protein [Chloroflexota bacterium]HHW88679.1 DUF1992 domain-containing protein [Chloroflexota bacterium]
MTTSTPDPNARAETYRRTRQGDDEITPQRAPQRTPEQWRDLISQRIEDAMHAGLFDNLRNKGKPLDPAPEPHVPPDMQMANSLLKNNDLTPAWIADRNAMLAEIERFRTRLRKIVMEFQAQRESARSAVAQAALEQRWQTQLTTWQEEIRLLNRRIELQNFKQPVTFLEIVKLRLADEIKRAGG